MSCPYKKAVLNRPPVIFNKRLKPLSLFHAMMLEEFGSPFMLKDVEADDIEPGQVFLAVYICCLDWQNGPEAIWEIWHDPAALELIYKGFEGLRVEEKDKLTLLDYVSDYLDAPKLWEKPDAVGDSGIPWQFKVAADLMLNMSGLTEQRVWDMPISLAIAYRTNIAENHGFQVYSERDKADLAKLKAQREAREKEEQASK